MDATRHGWARKRRRLKRITNTRYVIENLSSLCQYLFQLTEARKGEETKEIACKETTTRGDEEKRAEMKEKNSGKKRKLKGRNDNASKG